MSFKMLNYGLLAAAGLVAAITLPSQAEARSKRERASCTVSIDSTSVGVIGGGGGGQGRLTCHGKSYNFTIAGATIGTIGVSTMHATGSVYRLKNVDDFSGTYGQVQAGGTVGTKGDNYMLLENEHGVVMRLRASSRGLALQLGGSVMVVSMK